MSAPPAGAVRPMTGADWPAVEAIYREGIASRLATFETDPPDRARWDAGHLAAPRLVYEAAGEVLGWAALSAVSARAVYRGVAEVSVYVAFAAHRRGIGEALLRALIEASEARGVWTLQASIFARNGASIRLHERCGFRRVGHRERIAMLDCEWLDTVLLERRSARVGGAGGR